MSSTASRHVGTSSLAGITGNIPETYVIQSSNGDGFVVDYQYSEVMASGVWRGDDPLSRLRRAVATWLSGNPYPSLGPRRAPLSEVLHVVHREPALSPIWLNSATPLTHLKLVLLGPESREIFMVTLHDGQEVLSLDELALRRAAASASGIVSEPEPLHIMTSPWRFTAVASAGPVPLRSSLSGDNSIGAPFSVESNSALTATASFMTSSSTALTLTNCTGSGQHRGVLAVGLEEGPESFDPHSTLAQPILNAIAVTWPGNMALARLKRRAALALAAATDGPEGPHSMLASALGDVLHRHEADAVAELRHPVTKTLRVKQLLHEGGPIDAIGATASVPHGLIGQHPAGVVAGAPCTEGPGFLRVVKGKFDIVVVLDLPGLMHSHEHRRAPSSLAAAPQGAAAASSSAAAAVAAAAGAGAMLLPASFSGSGVGTLLQPSTSLPSMSSRLPLARSASDLATAFEQSFVGPGVGQPVALGGLLLQGPGGGSGGAAAAAAAATHLVEGVPELALRAFPGPSAAAQLRRAIVIHLAGQPRRSQQWTHLGTFVATSQAQLWLKPANRWPKLKSFVMHPDSRGVFLDVQLPGPGPSAGLVALDPAALRRAAAAGLATAITAAWPGHGPLERIRRAAAFTLAMAVRGPAGPYTMLGSALGTSIRKRDKDAFDALAGMGKLSELLDDTATAGSGGTAGGGGGGGAGGISGVSGGSISRDPQSGGGASCDAAAAAIAANAASATPSDGAPTGPSTGAGVGGVRASSDGGGGATTAGSGRRSSGHGSRSSITGGGGAGGAGGGGGYIVSFKKDQDGYMRLRLEALLQEWPKEDSNAAAALAAAAAAGPGSASPSGITTTATATIGRLLPFGGVAAAAPDAPASELSGYTAAAAQATASLQIGLAPPAFASTLHPTASLQHLLPGTAAVGVPGSAGPGGLILAGAGPSQTVLEVGSPPLEQELLRRFPTPPGAPGTSEEATIAAAKRCIARLLAWAPPPHQLTFAKLGAQVPKLLGGARIGRNLRLVCLEESDVFAVQSQSPTVHVVRLVCPRLLQLAREQSERKLHSATQNHQPQQPGQQQQQQQGQGQTLPQVMQVFVHHPAGAVQHPAGAHQLAGVLQLQGQPGQHAGGISQLQLQQLQQQQLQQQQQQQQGQTAAVAAAAAAAGLMPSGTGLASRHDAQNQLRVVGAAQRLMLQPRSQLAESDVELQQRFAIATQQAQSIGGSELGRSGTAGWGSAAGWQQLQPGAGTQQQPAQQMLQRHQSTAHDLLLLQQQQQHPGAISTLQQPQGSAVAGSSGVGGVPSRLYGERLSVTGSTPLPSLSSVSSVGPDAFGAAMEGTSLSWQGAGTSSGLQHQGQVQPQQQQQQQQHMAAVAATAANRPGAGGAGQRIRDFTSAALVAEQALLQQHSRSQGTSGSGAAAAAAALQNAAIHVLSDPYSPDFLAVLQHCHACAQIGIAVQVYDGRPALVSLYAPSVMVAPGGVNGGAVGAEAAWSPAVYVIDCTASSAGEGPEAVVGTLMASLRSLLEEPGVAKVVHGCEQVRALELATGASIAPLLDTNVLLSAILTMLPPLPPPPAATTVAMAAAAGSLPLGGYSPPEATALAQLSAHVSGLRAVLQSVDLWADRPELIAVLGGVHFAAHRAELWAAAGRDSNWLSRPLSEGQVAVAAQSVHHLPELWAALCEAVPWLAAHAALRVMQHLRSSGLGASSIRVQR